LQLKVIVEIGVAIAALLLVPLAIAVIRVRMRRERNENRRIPLRPYVPKPRAMTNRIDDYLMEAIAATGTRLPTNLPVAPRVARGSVAPPPRADTVRDVSALEFEDDPPTLVSLRRFR
jgi:hypothetical protein